ncbi:DNA polymerase-4 [Lipingzhangella halophila]|uniref:DNA polymerase IV n=1 Tax=Lipingzhangella halophila TaxID=1783352 RepID=A0A7W7RF89_9ACTN|nr:DNA polymerase IV [Lipingzhangella halophila]MBB4930934.1 DNA polymerase-4 [Lipingzhangella halophila]
MSRRQLERGAALRGMVGAAGIEPLPAGDAGADDNCPILHIDMDAFFASVEQLRYPETRGQPVIVGGTGPRGVVSSADYVARTYGVHSAMPMSRAMRLCPDAVVLPPDGKRYRRASEAVMDIFRSVTPDVESLSLDEAFLDVSGARRRLGGPARIAGLVRERVSQEQQLTCSVGVAPSKFVAKLASTQCKPDGMLLVPEARVTDFLHPLPVGALWGVGPRTEEALRRRGLRTVGDVARVPVDTLRRELGDALGAHLGALARGYDDRGVESTSADRSIGSEETFDTDVANVEVIHRELLKLSEKVARRLRGSGQVGRTIVVKLRRADFSTITRSCTLAEHTDVARDINSAARGLYDAAGLQGERLRLVGVRVEGLADSAEVHHQLAIGEPEAGRREAEQAMDQATRRFGPGVVGPATLAKRDKNDG